MGALSCRRRRPYRSDGFLLWLGAFEHLPYLLRWLDGHPPPFEVRLLTNLSSRSGRVAGHFVAHELGISLRVTDSGVNGYPAQEWSEAAQRELMQTCRAAIDIKGDSFNQRTKPPTKAQQFIASGVPFGCNPGHPAIDYFHKRGFEVADAADFDRLLSRPYWEETQRFAALAARKSVAAGCSPDLSSGPGHTVMRLLFWTSSYGQTIGGGPVLAPLLAAALVRRGHEVTVLTDRRPESLAEMEELEGVRIYRPLFRRALAGEVALIPGIRRQIADLKDKMRPDLAFIFSSGYGEFFHHVTEAARRLPLIVGLHDLFAEKDYRPDLTVGRNLGAADWVTACSHAVLDRAIEHLPALRPISTVIHNALPMPEWAAHPAPPPMTIAFAGRLIAKKGADVLIAAVDQLKDRYPGLHLSLAGDGDERAALEADAARRGLASRINFVGSLAHEAIYPFLASAALVIVPSRIEPFGLVALEAAQAGRPVIASAVDGLPEVVAHEQTGLLVPPADATALAAAIASLLDNPDRAKAMGEAGRRRAERHFSWDRYVAAHEDLFQQVAGR